MELTKDSLDKRIACVIVTYNRKRLLKRCLDAVASQTYKPIAVYITDNASTDGTIESVKEWGYYECEKEGICFKYILNSKNEGGSGGFYHGMKTAFNDGMNYDAFWVMDDDGEPEINCLENLCLYMDRADYIAPIVLSDEDHSTCSFSCEFDEVKTFAMKMQAKDGVITNWASPFNGVLYSREVLKTVGFPIRDMFIWGDEVNFHYRCIRKGFIPITVLKSVHYHPLNRQEIGKWAGVSFVINIDADWKVYCYIRNTIYNKLRVLSPFPKNIYNAIKGAYAIPTYYYKVKRKNILLLLSAVFAGFFGYFKGLNKYMN